MIIFTFMRALLLLLVFHANILSAVAQCNGSIQLCDKKYNEVSFLTTHNAFNCAINGYSFPNQNISITEQLNLGVRAFMLDIYDLFGTVTVYHGTFLLGSQPLSEILQEISDFINNNPNEVITIILENYVSSSQIETSFQNAGLLNSLYGHTPGNEWPSLQELINSGKNIVLFNDQDNALPTQPWNHFMWSNMVETHYSVSDPNLFTHDFNRGDSINDLFIFNHFITDASIGIGLENQAIIVNEYNFLMNRIQENFLLKQKLPNFITLDFVSVGEGLSVVNDINQNGLFVKDIERNEISVYPNPATSELIIDLKNFPVNESYQLEIVDLTGRTILSQRVNTSNIAVLITDQIPRGSYLLRIHNDSEHFISSKIVLK